jgi:hypothetical protein
MSISFLIISLLCFALAIAANLLFPVNFVNEKVILTSMLGVVGFPTLWYAGYLRQHLIITSDKLILKNMYKTMVILNANEITRIETKELPTYYSWATTIYKKYICIYSIQNNDEFVRGSSNKSGVKKIQLLYNKDILLIIKNMIKNEL